MGVGLRDIIAGHISKIHMNMILRKEGWILSFLVPEINNAAAVIVRVLGVLWEVDL